MSAPIARSEDSTFDLLPWDSERFGFSVARVRGSVSPETLAVVVDQLRERGVVLAYYGLAGLRPGISEKDAARLEARLVDTRLVFRKDLEVRVARGGTTDQTAPVHRTDVNGAALDIRSVREQDVGPALIQLARSAGHYSRFRVDPRIPPAVFHAIYDAWLLRSVRREIADEVFVGSVGGEDVGLVTVAAETDATIGLLSISDSMRGRGLGRAMTQHAFRWAADRRCRVLRVTTQLANAAACALYTSVGASVESRERTYHIWLA
jgi:dTDP-4-amino-4,6-dideoxy-D-galactose acyltransferase